jgi:prefoldin subunit 5
MPKSPKRHIISWTTPLHGRGRRRPELARLVELSRAEVEALQARIKQLETTMAELGAAAIETMQEGDE